MTTLITRVLRKLHILPPLFDENDIINASIEDKERDVTNRFNTLAGTLKKRSELDRHLRESIKIAREATHSFADFERLTIRRREQGND